MSRPGIKIRYPFLFISGIMSLLFTRCDKLFSATLKRVVFPASFPLKTRATNAVAKRITKVELYTR